MLAEFDIWKFIAGLGIFLFGMHLLEESLKHLTGRTFKQFLKKHTKNKYKAVLSGTLVTALLQSSSVVSLMTLAFVGAGVISMRNALGIIFGSNLGTTFTGWIVATLGFKLDIAEVSLPVIGIGAIIMVVLNKWERISTLGKGLVSFGFIFLGLDFMKTSIEYLASDFDINLIVGYGILIFLLVGFIFTAIIQSSSATMVITLSALSTGIISFPSAAAMIIGADLGTTITALIGGMPGVAAKKRVALGHFLFNLIVDLIAFIILFPLIRLVKDVIGIQDNVMALVVFHSMFNLIGIAIFLPVINHFASFLEHRFTTENHAISKYIKLVTEDVPEAAITALKNEANDLIQKVIVLQKSVYRPETNIFRFRKATFIEKYYHLKHLEGEMFVFHTKLQQQLMTEEESSRLHQLMLVMRYALHAAKSIKDVAPNLHEFYDSGKKQLNDFHTEFKKANDDLFVEFIQIARSKHSEPEALVDLLKMVESNYEQILHHLNVPGIRKKMTELEISSVLTVNREIFSSQKSIIYALNFCYLSLDEARQFMNLPQA